MGLPQEFLNRSLVIKYLHQFSKTEICGVELENVDKIRKILLNFLFRIPVVAIVTSVKEHCDYTFYDKNNCKN